MNINKIILMGRLTADPELRMSQSNIPNVRFTLAVNRKHTKQGENPTADFFNCVAFRNSAEFISKYFKKGSSMIVFGSVQFDKYKDKDGNDRTATNVIVDEVQFGESKQNTKTETNTASGFDSSDFEELELPEGEVLPF